MTTALRLEKIGMHFSRFGLVLVLLWIGGMKFTTVEAEGVRPLVANSPLISWAYRFFDTKPFSELLGILEIIFGLMIASRPIAAGVSAIGSLFAAVMFLVTLSFIVTTPGWEPSLGFPALSVVPGQFVLKDVVLLGTALLTAGEALTSAKSHCPSTQEHAGPC